MEIKNRLTDDDLIHQTQGEILRRLERLDQLFDLVLTNEVITWLFRPYSYEPTYLKYNLMHQ